MNKQWLIRLYRHMEWADARVWASVRASETAATDDFVRDSLVHLHVVQHAYLNGWRGDTPEYRAIDDFPSLEALRAWGRTVYADAFRFLDSVDEAELAATPDVLWPDLIEEAIGQPPVPIPLGDMVFQVAAHSIHHRAQINRRLREIGAEPPFIDYVSWAWWGEPEADWS